MDDEEVELQREEIITFITYYWYLRKPHIRGYLGVGVKFKLLGQI